MAILKLRRRSKFPDLRGLPLDGVDMFLLSRLDGELTLNQLVDLVPVCDPEETELRVYQLARLGLIDGPPVRVAVPPSAPDPITAPPPAQLLEAADESESEAEALITARPPAPQRVLEAILTAPPPSPDYEEMATLPPAPKSQVRANPLAETEKVDADQTARIRPRF